MVLSVILTASSTLALDPSRSFQENFLRYQAKQRQQLTYSDELKAQAEQGAHDDLIMALAIAWQLYQSESPPSTKVRTRQPRPRVRLHV
jgi:hypothetical protein